METKLTPEQRAKLADLAKGVIGSFTTLPLTDVLNRIHLITDYPYDRCVKGLRMMLQEELIAATFIPDLHRLDSMSRTIDRSMPIIEATGSELVKVEEHVSEGPTDDEPDMLEGGDVQMQSSQHPVMKQIANGIADGIARLAKQPNLSHINSNF